MGQRRCDCLPPGLLSKSGPARAGATCEFPGLRSIGTGALKVTIRKFYRPSGASTQLQGVKADIVLPSTTDLNEIGESAMKDPLPWDTEPSTRFAKEDRVQPVLEALRARSAQRVATEPGFSWIRGEIALRHKSAATKSVSLNEAERRAEKEQLKARKKAHEQELARLAEQSPRVYEITLKNADKPGLPPPLTTQPAKANASESADEDTPSVSDRDVIMNEAQRILADYVGMETAPAPQCSFGPGETAKQTGPLVSLRK